MFAACSSRTPLTQKAPRCPALGPSRDASRAAVAEFAGEHALARERSTSRFGRQLRPVLGRTRDELRNRLRISSSPRLAADARSSRSASRASKAIAGIDFQPRELRKRWPASIFSLASFGNDGRHRFSASRASETMGGIDFQPREYRERSAPSIFSLAGIENDGREAPRVHLPQPKLPSFRRRRRRVGT